MTNSCGVLLTMVIRIQTECVRFALRVLELTGGSGSMRQRGFSAGCCVMLALLTTACDKATPSAERQSTTFDVRSSPSGPDPHRASGPQLALIIGSRCSEPGRMQYKGDRGDKAVYAVKCLGDEFLVSMGPDGRGDALTCADAAQQGTPCWEKW